jgi:nucleoside-diphosphate-sugar epimerase
MMRVAVIGASGQLGATVVENLSGRAGVDVVPFIHSSGNAWRLARRGMKLATLDLLDPEAVKRAVDGCTHVVNCSRGDVDVMFGGLRNLLDAAQKARVRRFIHISSVLVYGDPPHPESRSESAPTSGGEKKSYGWIKLRQDEMVAAAARRGLNAIILCPPNIIGPYSQFLNGLANAIRRDEFALVGDRECPVNLVDVANLAHAIELALEKGPSRGERLFITDDDAVDWRTLVHGVARIVAPGNAHRGLPAIDAATLARLKAGMAAPKPSLVGSLKHLVSSDVREALRADPLIASIEDFAKSAVTKSGGAVEARLRGVAVGPVSIRKTGQWDRLNVGLAAQQLRGVRHSNQAARDLLGYFPVCSFEQSMAAYARWFRVSQGMETEAWPLLRQLA